MVQQVLDVWGPNFFTYGQFCHEFLSLDLDHRRADLLLLDCFAIKIYVPLRIYYYFRSALIFLPKVRF